MPDMLEFWMPFIRSKANGVEVLSLPDGDVTLANGSILHNYTKVVYRHGKEFDHGYNYRGPEKLHVIVTSCSTSLGLILHVSISYPHRSPTQKEIDFIKQAFYPKHINCRIESKKEWADGQYYSIIHIWQLPPGKELA